MFQTVNSEQRPALNLNDSRENFWDSLAGWQATPASRAKEGKAMPVFGTLFFHLYAIPSRCLRVLILTLLLKLEGGELYSLTMRRIFKKFYEIDVGMYSYSCFKALQFRQPTRIGRYCSIYHTVQAFNANHPMNLVSTHPLFFNSQYGKIGEDLIARTKLVIGNDVFIGHNVTILPSVNSIGDGAVIGAGSVVSKDVPPYGIVIGNPARLIRFRFRKETIDKLLASKWWERSIDDLAKDMQLFQKPLNNSSIIR